MYNYNLYNLHIHKETNRFQILEYQTANRREVINDRKNPNSMWTKMKFKILEQQTEGKYLIIAKIYVDKNETS